MNYQAIFFDLDGTLLPMDQETFVKYYFGLLAKKCAPYGFEPKALIDGIWKGIAAMVQNDGSCTNQERFWETFKETFPFIGQKEYEVFEDFYKNEFNQAKAACGFNDLSKQVVEMAKQNSRVILATNPIFPSIATYNRVQWAGLKLEDFEYITTYENSCFSKPNPKYYLEIVQHLNLDPKQCLMIGNDVQEDMVANTIGMDTFLVTDCLINAKEKDISMYRQGSMADLLKFLEKGKL